MRSSYRTKLPATASVPSPLERGGYQVTAYDPGGHGDIIRSLASRSFLISHNARSSTGNLTNAVFEAERTLRKAKGLTYHTHIPFGTRLIRERATGQMMASYGIILDNQTQDPANPNFYLANLLVARNADHSTFVPMLLADITRHGQEAAQVASWEMGFWVGKDTFAQTVGLKKLGFRPVGSRTQTPSYGEAQLYVINFQPRPQ